MLKKDDQVTIEIEDIGTDGAGIGKADGYTLFVKDAVIGVIISMSLAYPYVFFALITLAFIISPITASFTKSV